MPNQKNPPNIPMKVAIARFELERELDVLAQDMGETQKQARDLLKNINKEQVALAMDLDAAQTRQIMHRIITSN